MLPFGEPEPIFDSHGAGTVAGIGGVHTGHSSRAHVHRRDGRTSQRLQRVGRLTRDELLMGLASWFGTEAGIAWPRLTFTGAGGGVTFFGGAGAITTGFGRGTTTGLISGTLTGSGILILGVSIFGGGGIFTLAAEAAVAASELGLNLGAQAAG